MEQVAAGSYSLTAVATDDGGATSASQPVTVTVGAPANKPPTVPLSTPAAGASFTAPASVSMLPMRWTRTGRSTKVDFFANGQLVGSDTTNPYSVTWSNVPAGTYNLTAVATDNAGATGTSQQVTVTVAAPANKPPTVSITAPTASASSTAPASISISATAADTDGTVARVDFYAGTQLVGFDTSTPFSVSWSNAAAGTYSLTAVATDNTGAKTTSAAVTVTVAPPPNKPPTASISAPAAGTVYTAPRACRSAQLRAIPTGRWCASTSTRGLS